MSPTVPIRLAATLLAGLLSTAVVQAQDYPNRPIKIIVPFSPGGAVDGPTRAIAQELGKRLNQQVIIDNKPGAGATIGSELVAKSPADGYTLLLASQTNAISATLYTKLSFNPIDDFAPISLLGREPGVLVVHPSLPVKTVAELVALAKQKPGQLNYASSGNGSGQHLFMAMFASMAELNMMHVPYRGSGQATTDLLGGQVQMAIPGTQAMVKHIKDGKLRALATTGVTRSPALPDVPTLAESGSQGLLGVCLDGPAGAQGHAAGDHRAAAARAQGHAGDRGGDRLHEQRGHGSHRLDAGGVRRLLPRGARPLGAHRQGNRRKNRLTPTPEAAAPLPLKGAPLADRRSRIRGGCLDLPTTTQIYVRDDHWQRTLDHQEDADGDVKLFLWEKFVGSPEGKPAVLFVHGSSMASQPTFDLSVPGRPDSSVMDWFAERGFVCWCVDMEGYGRCDKTRDIFCDIANGADDLDGRHRLHRRHARRRAAS